MLVKTPLAILVALFGVIGGCAQEPPAPSRIVAAKLIMDAASAGEIWKLEKYFMPLECLLELTKTLATKPMPPEAIKEELLEKRDRLIGEAVEISRGVNPATLSFTDLGVTAFSPGEVSEIAKMQSGIIDDFGEVLVQARKFECRFRILRFSGNYYFANFTAKKTI